MHPQYAPESRPTTRCDLPVPTTQAGGRGVPMSGKKKPGKGKKYKKSNIKALDGAPRYDVVSELTNAPSGITFGQLLRGDAVGAQKDMKRLFTSRPASRTAAAVREAESSVPRVLLVAPTSIFGTRWWALLDSGSIPNLMSRRMV